jgi:hypothetical protein
MGRRRRRRWRGRGGRIHRGKTVNPICNFGEGGGVGGTGGGGTAKHVMVTIGKRGRGRVSIADRRKFEEGGGSANDVARPFIRVDEPPTNKVHAICSGMGTGGGGRKGLRGSGRVLEVEEGGREYRNRIGHPHRGGGADARVITAAVCDGRSYVKGTRGVGRPGRTNRGRVKGIA